MNKEKSKIVRPKIEFNSKTLRKLAEEGITIQEFKKRYNLK